MRFNHEDNRREFKERFGFLPSEIAWEPQTTMQDRRDNRDPEKIGAAILGRVKRWPTTGVCTHADRVTA